VSSWPHFPPSASLFVPFPIETKGGGAAEKGGLLRSIVKDNNIWQGCFEIIFPFFFSLEINFFVASPWGRKDGEGASRIAFHLVAFIYHFFFFALKGGKEGFGLPLVKCV